MKYTQTNYYLSFMHETSVLHMVLNTMNDYLSLGSGNNLSEFL